MNYKAQGAPKMGRNAPRHSEHNQPGSDKDPFGKRSGKRPGKEELLERMKAAREKASEGKTSDMAEKS